MTGDGTTTQYVHAIALSGFLIMSGAAEAEDLLSPPSWMPDVELGFTESYNDNIFGVSGLGLKPEGSWISTVSPKIGFDFAPLLGNQSIFQKLSLSYTPDFVIFHEAPSEDYDAHRFNTAIAGTNGGFSFSLDNNFLYNDGSREAPIYALNQLSGPPANQLDKYRSQYADTPARERRNQIQDRESTRLQYDWDKIFLRATSALLLYDMNTVFHNSSKAPYLGYQNYPSRYDVHFGPDLGYRVTTNLALTVGYRYGSQYQQQLPASISSDSHFSSGTYQQLLLGAEGHPWRWFAMRLDAGPDFHQYNSDAPVNNFHPARYYGEASATADIAAGQSLSFKYRNWSWLSSSGLAPEEDSSYALVYHWSATRQLGLDLAGKILQADYTIGNDDAGTAPSFRIDRLYEIAPSATWAFNPHFSASLNYIFDAGNNELSSILDSRGSYKNFTRNTVSLGLNYTF